MLEIDDGIEVPSKRGGVGSEHRSQARDTIEALTPGQSFAIPYKTPADFRSARNLAYNVSQKLPRKFTVRVMGDTIRIWRVS